MSLYSHAKYELELIGEFEYGPELKNSILELIEVFAKQRHSGGSASLCREIFHKLVNYEPLTPLTGQDTEWTEISENVFQNKRCSRVFKDGTIAYDIEGLIFKDKGGNYYTNKNSKTRVTFPYIPSSKYVNVD